MVFYWHIANLISTCPDPTEHNDLAESNPDIVTELLAELTAQNATVYQPNRGPADDLACTAALARGGVWGPFVFP